MKGPAAGAIFPPMNHDELLQFPCEFVLKVMVRGDGDLPARVHEIVTRHAPDTPEDALTTRASRKGNYLGVTVRLTATSREQLDALYRELTAQDWVLMAL